MSHCAWSPDYQVDAHNFKLVISTTCSKPRCRSGRKEEALERDQEDQDERPVGCPHLSQVCSGPALKQNVAAADESENWLLYFGHKIVEPSRLLL